MKVVFSKGTAKGKKMKAIFYNKDKDGKMKKIKTIQFGATGYLDYTIGGTKEQRERYRKRHTNNKENHSNPMTAGTLSFFILWGESTSKTVNIKNFKKRFKLQ